MPEQSIRRASAAKSERHTARRSTTRQAQPPPPCRSSRNRSSLRSREHALQWPHPWRAYILSRWARGVGGALARSRFRGTERSAPRRRQDWRSGHAQRRTGPADAPLGGAGAVAATCSSASTVGCRVVVNTGDGRIGKTHIFCAVSAPLRFFSNCASMACCSCFTSFAWAGLTLSYCEREGQRNR
jgi:hypothetical protein